MLGNSHWNQVYFTHCVMKLAYWNTFVLYSWGYYVLERLSGWQSHRATLQQIKPWNPEFLFLILVSLAVFSLMESIKDWLWLKKFPCRSWFCFLVQSSTRQTKKSNQTKLMKPTGLGKARPSSQRSSVWAHWASSHSPWPGRPVRGAHSRRFSGPLPTEPSRACIRPVDGGGEDKHKFRLHLLFWKPKTLRKILEKSMKVPKNMKWMVTKNNSLLLRKCHKTSCSLKSLLRMRKYTLTKRMPFKKLIYNNQGKELRKVKDIISVTPHAFYSDLKLGPIGDSASGANGQMQKLPDIPQQNQTDGENHAIVLSAPTHYIFLLFFYWVK